MEAVHTEVMTRGLKFDGIDRALKRSGFEQRTLRLVHEGNYPVIDTARLYSGLENLTGNKGIPTEILTAMKNRFTISSNPSIILVWLLSPTQMVVLTHDISQSFIAAEILARQQ